MDLEEISEEEAMRTEHWNRFLLRKINELIREVNALKKEWD